MLHERRKALVFFMPTVVSSASHKKSVHATVWAEAPFNAVICQTWCVQHAVGGWVTMHQNNWLPIHHIHHNKTKSAMYTSRSSWVSSPSKCKGRSYAEGRGTQSSLLAFRLERFGGSHQEKKKWFQAVFREEGSVKMEIESLNGWMDGDLPKQDDVSLLRLSTGLWRWWPRALQEASFKIWMKVGNTTC